MGSIVIVRLYQKMYKDKRGYILKSIQAQYHNIITNNCSMYITFPFLICHSSMQFVYRLVYRRVAIIAMLFEGHNRHKGGIQTENY